MAEPYRYQYGGGVLDTPGKGQASARAAYQRDMDTAQAKLDTYTTDAGSEYDKLASKSMYIVKGGGGKHSKRTGELTSLSFTEQQMKGLMPSLEDVYGKTHGGINVRQVDKALLQQELDLVSKDPTAWYDSFVSTKAYHEKYDPRSQVGALYAAGQQMDKFVESSYDPSGMGDVEVTSTPYTEGMDIPRQGKVVDKEDREVSIANYKKNLEMLIGGADDAYFSYLAPHGERGSDIAYGQLQKQLYTAEGEARQSYIDSIAAQVTEQQGILDTSRLELEDAQRQAEKRARAKSELYSKLFNTRGGGYM